MAQIFSFPGGLSGQGRAGRAARSDARRPPQRPDGIPDQVWEAVLSISGIPQIPGVQWHEVPVPHSIADYGIGVGIVCVADSSAPVVGRKDSWLSADMRCEHSHACADSRSQDMGDVAYGLGLHRLAEDTAWGWITLLYFDDPPRGWTSHWRCVGFCRVPINHWEDGFGERRTSRCWNAISGRLIDAGVDADSIAGTVTVSHDTSFGMADSEVPSRFELRVSWTPPARSGTSRDTVDAGFQVSMWSRLLMDGLR
ncbi:DUF3000 family protein [Bifidobacterium apri]|uniref:DUF3000 family protein n=1 Tax=Bifidobacterium apri TaxID=1769423 RepID=UPI0039943DD1